MTRELGSDARLPEGWQQETFNKLRDDAKKWAAEQELVEKQPVEDDPGKQYGDPTEQSMP